METPKYRPIPIAEIKEPPKLLRGQVNPERLQELAHSMNVHGLLQAILVKPTDDGYVVIAGDRRFLAAKSLGWEKIDARILPKSTTADLTLALIENIQREDLTPIEEARLIHHFVHDLEKDVDSIAFAFGKKRHWVDTRLDLLGYPPDILTAIHAGHITLAVAKELAPITGEAYRTYLIESARDNGCTARVARMWFEDWRKSHPDPDQRITANTGPSPPYEGQAVGIGCGWCRRLFPVAELKPVYGCQRCLIAHHQLLDEAHAKGGN